MAYDPSDPFGLRALAVPQMSAPQMQLQNAQQIQQRAANMGPTTSGLAVGLNGLSGYLGGQQERNILQANPGLQTQNGQPSLFQNIAAKLLSGQNPSSAPAAPAPPAAPDDQSGLPLGRKSDRRLKSDVRRIGTLACGLPLYAYRLEGSPLFEVGCMADEVALVRPDATWFDPDDGFARVDYRKVL